MDTATKRHIALGGFLATSSILALYFRWSGLASGAVVVIVNVYLVAILYEAAFRSAAVRKVENHELLAKPARLFPFPSKSWTGMLILFIVVASICGFANMYIDSAGIAYVGPMFDSGMESTIAVPASSTLETKVEALYFSLVTMITLGYGDFLPISSAARMIVMWQLATGGLLVIGIFPLITSRAADF